MKTNTTATGYRALAALAFLLLWGFFAFNGALIAMLKGPLTGRLSPDTPLRNSYTGVFVVDYPVSLLVAFFHYGTNGSDEGFQLLVFEGYSTLESAYVWLYAESIRPGSRPWTIASYVALS